MSLPGGSGEVWEEITRRRLIFSVACCFTGLGFAWESVWAFLLEYALGFWRESGFAWECAGGRWESVKASR